MHATPTHRLSRFRLHRTAALLFVLGCGLGHAAESDTRTLKKGGESAAPAPQGKGATDKGSALTRKEPPAGGAPAAKSAAPVAAAESVTTISAKKRLLLDPKGREATFYGEVQVVDSRFSLSCDKLTVHLKSAPGEILSADRKEAGVGGDVDGAKPLDGAKPESPARRTESRDGSGEGGLDRVVAEGNVIIYQEKINEKGERERSIGRAQKALYDSQTGVITLSGWPQVEQQQNTIVGMEEGTVILLNKKGSLEVLGHSKSVLRNTKVDNAR